MASTPRTVKVTITADTRPFIRGIRRARRQMWLLQHGNILVAGLALGLAIGVNMGILLAISAR